MNQLQEAAISNSEYKEENRRCYEKFAPRQKKKCKSATKKKRSKELFRDGSSSAMWWSSNLFFDFLSLSVCRVFETSCHL